jgi:anti-sigma B factor antagonist
MPREAAGDGFAISSRPVADGVVMVEIRGDLDIQTVPPIKTFLAHATATGPRHLILDLTGVEFLASSGLGLLIAVSYGDDGIQGWRHLLGVTGNRRVERPLAAVALLDMFDIATDIDTLLAELDSVEPATDATPPHEQPSTT